MYQTSKGRYFGPSSLRPPTLRPAHPLQDGPHSTNAQLGSACRGGIIDVRNRGVLQLRRELGWKLRMYGVFHRRKERIQSRMQDSKLTIWDSSCIYYFWKREESSQNNEFNWRIRKIMRIRLNGTGKYTMRSILERGSVARTTDRSISSARSYRTGKRMKSSLSSEIYKETHPCMAHSLLSHSADQPKSNWTCPEVRGW